ncbi:MAG: phospholipase D-like domain-containing protein [Phycisphaeraceae bacterium]
MQLSEFDDILRTTLEDARLSRGERQSLSQVLADLPLDHQQLGVLRHHAFNMVREHLDHSPNKPVLDWLEEVLKVLTPPPADGSAACESHAYFSPENNVARVIVDLIDQDHKTIDICVFTITDDRIARAILRAHRRGCAIRIVTDHAKAFDTGSDIEEFRKAGIAVRTDRSDHHMHHKFAIFNNASLLTGSYNWTRNAALFNEENIIVTADPSLVRDFRITFERLWKEFG